MARRGRFGRRPRTSPDLTATIVSMAREYQSKMDQNILNSWDKGGKVDGRQVTDEYLLDYLGKRRNGLSKDDPLYAEMDQRLSEYTFAVANSKQELGYAEHKFTDSQMASFYRTWGNKLPQNSEAWRKMMTLAAQYKDRAAKTTGGGGGGGRGTKKPKYDSAANRFPSNKEFAYDTMLDALNFVAHREGILNTTDEDLSDLRVAEDDASRLVQLLNVLATDPTYAKYREGLTKAIRQNGNPGFSGAFTWQTLQSEETNKRAGLTNRLRIAQKAGHKTDIKALTKELGENGSLYVALTAAKPLEKYEQARHIYDTVTDDPNATPIDLFVAMNGYRTALEGIHDDIVRMGQPNDLGLATTEGHVVNELRALDGQDINAPTLWEDSRGTVAAYRQTGGVPAPGKEPVNETGKWKLAYDDLNAQMDALVSGTGVISRVDTNGQPTADPDAGYAVVPMTAVPANAAWAPTGGGNPTKTIDFNGKTVDVSGVMTAVLPTPIYTVGATGLDYAGRPDISTATPKVNTNIANMFVMPDGTELAQYWDSNGTKRWTNDPDSLFQNPDGSSIPMEDTKDGLRLTVTAPPLRGGKSTYDPLTAIDPMFYNPLTADGMVNKVGLSSFSVWLNSTRTATSDPGVAYAMDPAVMARAIAAEVGPSGDVGAALQEAEEARTDYLTKTPDIDRRIRAAAEQGRTGTVADKAGIAGYADFGGLERDVVDFYDRLRTRQQTIDEGNTGELSRGYDPATKALEERRDATIRAALEKDANESLRIATIEDPGHSLMSSHIKDMVGQQARNFMQPYVAFQPGPSQADVVAQFKAMSSWQLGGVAGALASAPRPSGMPGGSRMTGGRPPSSAPTIPTPTAPPPRAPSTPPPPPPPASDPNASYNLTQNQPFVPMPYVAAPSAPARGINVHERR